MTSFPDDCFALLEKVVSIGAPTFLEEARSRFVHRWLEEAGCPGLGRDDMGNVWADLSDGGSDLILLDAHLDTVFPHAEIAIRKTEDTWHAPGIFDNTVACVLLMVWIRQKIREGRRVPFLVTFTVGEEGTGDLRGMREMARRFRPRAKAACVFDLDLGMTSRQAVGSRRYRAAWSTRGGHSWNDFGTPSAIHLAARWIDHIENLPGWEHGRRSFNVGTIEGGTGINVVADRASLTLDVRSIEPEFLRDFDEWIGQLEAPFSPAVLEVIGDRPAGELRADHALVSILRRVHETLHLDHREEAYSTNGNALLDAGIPTMVTGLANGGKIHTEEEFLNLNSVATGYEKLQVLTRELSAF